LAVLDGFDAPEVLFDCNFDALKLFLQQPIIAHPFWCIKVISMAGDVPSAALFAVGD
jgi:hypothetical protein